MNVARQFVKWVAGFALCLFVVVGLCWWLIPDEKLDPKIEAFTAMAVPPPAANNAYFTIWGFSASPEVDAHAAGRQIVAAHDRLLAAQKSLAKFRPNSAEFLGDHPLQFPKGRKRYCDPRYEHCLPIFLAKKNEIAAESAEYGTYLDRYRKIREYQDYGSAMSQVSSETPLPGWELTNISELVDGAIAQRMTSAATQRAALEELAAEILSWQRMLQSNDWLLTQMISVSMLHRKYQLVSDLMNRYPEAVARYPDLYARMTNPLDLGKTTIGNSLAMEMRFSLGNLHADQAKSTLSFQGWPELSMRAVLRVGALRPNATNNQYYGQFMKCIDFALKSPREVLAGRAAEMRRIGEETALSIGALFYNPLGRYINSKAFSDFSDYATRVHHLVAQSRLIEVQRRLIQDRVAAAQVNVAIAAMGPGLYDPFTEQPMKWDATSKQVSYSVHVIRYINAASVTLKHLK